MFGEHSLVTLLLHKEDVARLHRHFDFLYADKEEELEVAQPGGRFGAGSGWAAGHGLG